MFLNFDLLWAIFVITDDLISMPLLASEICSWRVLATVNFLESTEPSLEICSIESFILDNFLLWLLKNGCNSLDKILILDEFHGHNFCNM